MGRTQMGHTMARGIVAVATLLCAAAGLQAGTIRQNARSDYGQFEKKLSKDQAILHALDRLTFGPRPGDIAAVKKMGLDAWIDLQLHPEKIPRSAGSHGHEPRDAVLPGQLAERRSRYCATAERQETNPRPQRKLRARV